MKRLIELIAELTSQPWLLSATYHHALSDAVNMVACMSEEAFLPFMEAGEPDPLGYTTRDGIATVNIDGALMRKPQAIERMFGTTATDQIPQVMDSIADDPNVEAVIMEIDSQGGSVSGVQEAGAAVARLDSDIPVIAYTDGMMASGAYWIGSQARAVVASPSAKVGSVGVYVPLVDDRKKLERMGLKVELIKNRAGTFKGMGFTGTEVTGEQRELIQEQVEDIFVTFTETIRGRRPLVPDSSMQGQIFSGKKSQSAGLVDFVGDRSEVRDLARAEILRNRQSGFFRNASN